MLPSQLKETTMDPTKRTLLRVELKEDERATTADAVERLMGTQARGALRLHQRAGAVRGRERLDI